MMFREQPVMAIRPFHKVSCGEHFIEAQAGEQTDESNRK